MNSATLIPVSYTHLDVYKRQGQGGADVFAGVTDGFSRQTEIAVGVLRWVVDKDQVSPPILQCERPPEIPVAPNVAIDDEEGSVCLLYTSRCV